MDELKGKCKNELMQEREDKLLINQYTNHFLSESYFPPPPLSSSNHHEEEKSNHLQPTSSSVISPIDFSFSRFALNVAIFSEYENPQHMVRYT